MKCPHCAYEPDSHTQIRVEDPGVPEDGDISLCINCAGISVFNGNDLRPPTEDEYESFLMDRDVIDGVAAIRFMIEAEANRP